MKTRFFFGVFTGFAFASILFFFFVYFFPGTFRAVAQHERYDHDVGSANLYSGGAASSYQKQYEQAADIVLNYNADIVLDYNEEYSPYVETLIAQRRSSGSGAVIAYGERYTDYGDALVAYHGAYSHYGEMPVM